MLLRRLLAAFYTSLLAIVSLTIFESVSVEGGELGSGELFSVIFVYSIYVVPIVFVYGITSSLIAEGVSKKMINFKNSISFGLHVLFGAGFILPYSLFLEYHPFPELNVVNVLTHPVTVFGALFSIIFFITNFILRKKDNRKESMVI